MVAVLLTCLDESEVQLRKITPLRFCVVFVVVAGVLPCELQVALSVLLHHSLSIVVGPVYISLIYSGRLTLHKPAAARSSFERPLHSLEASPSKSGMFAVEFLLLKVFI